MVRYFVTLYIVEWLGPMFGLRSAVNLFLLGSRGTML